MKSNSRTNDTHSVWLQAVEKITGTGRISMCKKGKNIL